MKFFAVLRIVLIILVVGLILFLSFRPYIFDRLSMDIEIRDNIESAYSKVETYYAEMTINSEYEGEKQTGFSKEWVRIPDTARSEFVSGFGNETLKILNDGVLYVDGPGEKGEVPVSGDPMRQAGVYLHNLIGDTTKSFFRADVLAETDDYVKIRLPANEFQVVWDVYYDKGSWLPIRLERETELPTGVTKVEITIDKLKTNIDLNESLFLP